MTRQQSRWIFPAIFAGIILYQIFGHGPAKTPKPIPPVLKDRNDPHPAAGQVATNAIDHQDDDDKPKKQSQK